MLEFRFCFFIKKIKIVRDVLILILNVEIFNSRNMYVIIVMKIMERCGVFVMKFVYVVIGRLFILKLCFKCVFYVFYINFIYLFCIFYVFENMCIIYFVMFVKINFFYVFNILILLRLMNFRVFINILYDFKECNIINNFLFVGMIKFFCLLMMGVIGSGLEYYI